MNSRFIAHLDEQVPTLLRQLSLPGIAVAVIAEGRVQVLRTWGLANCEREESLTENHRFRLASISNPVTAWGVMSLVERGLLDLDAPVDDYLTRWKLPRNGFDPRGVTARGLLSHTAGLAAGGGAGVNPRFTMPSLVDTLSGENSLQLDEDQVAYYRHVGLELDEVLRPVTLVANPGEQFTYSNSGYGLLQLLIEEISGQPFIDYMQQAVLGPLGMQSSGFEDPVDTDAFATPYDEAGNEIPI